MLLLKMLLPYIFCALLTALYWKKLQDLEEQRIELLILNIWEYSNLYSANLLDKDEVQRLIVNNSASCLYNHHSHPPSSL